MKRVVVKLLVVASIVLTAHAQDEAEAAEQPLPAETATVVAKTPTQPTTPAPTLTAASKKHDLPHMELLSPIKRKDVDMSLLARAPCGGTKSGPVHYETTPGSRNIVAWRILKASPTGRCLIRVGDTPHDRDLVQLKPTDGSGGDDGSFPCGREVTSYESKEVRLPRDLNCDVCILQLVWLTDEGDQYRCTDFESTTAEVPECFGQCLNGGICKNGKCMCPESFSGSNCQYEEDGEEKSFLQVLMDDSVVLIVYALMIIAIAAVFIAAYQLYKKREAEKRRQQQVGAEKLTANNAGEPNQRSDYQQAYD